MQGDINWLLLESVCSDIPWLPFSSAVWELNGLGKEDIIINYQQGTTSDGSSSLITTFWDASWYPGPLLDKAGPEKTSICFMAVGEAAVASYPCAQRPVGIPLLTSVRAAKWLVFTSDCMFFEQKILYFPFYKAGAHCRYRGAWQATVHRAAKRQTWLSD